MLVPSAARPQPRDHDRGTLVRVAVGSAPFETQGEAEGGWLLRDHWGGVHARGSGAPDWLVERRNRRLRIVFPAGGRSTAWSDEPWTLSPESASEGARAGVNAVAPAAVGWGGRRYRGEVIFVASDTAILVINRVALEDYLRGVVPLEMGTRWPNEQAALEAQAVAARSYVVVRQRAAGNAPYDLTRSAWDQVYGGRAAEHPLADLAVAATAGVVLTWQGEVVQAPYHSTCGGRTASATEAWSGARDAAWLRSVRDTPEGSETPWCSISPRFRWERTLDRRALEEAVAHYVRERGGALLMAASGVRGARVEGVMPSGRVTALRLDTDGGPVRLSGTALRTALRTPRGEILNSTYFSLEPVIGRDGRLMQLTLHGTGNGHGVGMCQWGAIGRARAGQSAREILAAYYPGTALARLP